MDNPIKMLRTKRFSHFGRVVSQEDLADVLGISQSNVSRLQNAAISDINFGDLKKMAAFFEFDGVENMLQWDPEKPSLESKTESNSGPDLSEIPLPFMEIRNNIQILVTLDGTEEAVNRAMDLIGINHRHLKVI